MRNRGDVFDRADFKPGGRNAANRGFAARARALDPGFDFLHGRGLGLLRRIGRGGLRGIGWDVPDSEGTMFVWARIPAENMSSEEFALRLLERTGVMCTPGTSFGPSGEGYVRFALVKPVETINAAVAVIGKYFA